jgi:hypothetical protein
LLSAHSQLPVSHEFVLMQFDPCQDEF